MFNDLTTSGLEEEKDFTGGNFGVSESDVYLATIKANYYGQSEKGAKFIHIYFEFENGKRYDERFYITNRNGENFYSKDGKKFQLPGFKQANNICILTTGAELSAIDGTEEKVIKIYDYDAKAEVPKTVDSIVELNNQSLLLGIVKKSVYKQALNQSTGQYEDTNELRDTNEIHTVFHSEARVSVPEALAGITEPKAIDKWITGFQGKTIEPKAKKGSPTKRNNSSPTEQPKRMTFGKSQ